MKSTAGRDDDWAVPHNANDLSDLFGTDARPAERVASEAEYAVGDQVERALAELRRSADDYLHMPWPSVDELVGGIPAGTVGMVAGYSGNGKTTFAMNLTDQLLQSNRAVYYLGLESSPDVIRTQLACLRLHLDHGDVLSGKLKRDPEWPAFLSAIEDELAAQRAQAEHNRLLCGAQEHIDVAGLHQAAEDAAKAGADFLIVDHIDHVGVDATYEESVRAVRTLHLLAKRFGLRVLMMSQLNQASLTGDALQQYRPLRRTAIKMGGHKLEVAHYVLGVYRPIKADVTKEEMQAFKADQVDVSRLLAANTMAVNCLKNRLYGSREGRRALLHFHNGQIREKTSYDDAMQRIRDRSPNDERVPF